MGAGKIRSRPRRQRAVEYNVRFSDRSSLLTPEFVIDGKQPMMGSKREAVLKAIENSQSGPFVSFTFSSDRSSIEVGSGVGFGTVLLVHLAKRRVTRV